MDISTEFCQRVYWLTSAAAGGNLGLLASGSLTSAVPCSDEAVFAI
jgi:hypothetical protein